MPTFITEDDIENMTDDLKNAMGDLLSNGPNEEDEKRIRDSMCALENAYLTLSSEPEPDTDK